MSLFGPTSITMVHVLENGLYLGPFALTSEYEVRDIEEHRLKLEGLSGN
jgi:hypothetical protein